MGSSSDPSSSIERQRTKGKEIMEEEEEEEEDRPLQSPSRSDPTAEMTCGVCLSDVGRSIRGHIDSCDHYFCFVCIMEWAKVETRCPMCKQRFRSIHRPAVRGIFPRVRVVDVPERNQVYNPLGNESTTLSDPYANIMCGECKNTGNEELLLLCDLCDSASHTYCVGLGATVPEGDWYCRDCTKIRNEHSRNQSDSDGCNQDSYNSLRAVQASKLSFQESQMPVSTAEVISDGAGSNSSQNLTIELGFSRQNIVDLSSNSIQRDPPVRTPVSISEIISDGLVSNLPQGFTSEQAFEQQSIHEIREDTTKRDSVVRDFSIRGTAPSTKAKAKGEQHVRTLRQCRNLQGRIRQIRENWKALQSGSLTFSSNTINGSNIDHNNRVKTGVNSGVSRKPAAISSVSNEQCVDDSVSSNISNNARPHDVNKAWKMMEIAKSMEGTRKRPVLTHSVNLSGKGNRPKVIRDNNPSSFVSKVYNPQHVLVGHSTLKLVEKQYKFPVNRNAYTDNEEEVREHFHGIPGKVEKEKDDREHFHGIPVKVPRSHNMESPSHRLARVLPQEYIFCQKKPIPLRVAEGDLAASKGRDVLNCQDYVSYSAVQTSAPDIKPIVSSCGTVDSHEKKHDAASSADKTRNDDMNCSAKDEVQSLVKLNLKLQSKDQRLDADAFREVARVATHTILAACGLEHSKSSVRTVSKPSCKHNEQQREIRKSNLMPNSCRECFYAFVKDVVNSAFLEKISIRKDAS